MSEDTTIYGRIIKYFKNAFTIKFMDTNEKEEIAVSDTAIGFSGDGNLKVTKTTTQITETITNEDNSTTETEKTYPTIKINHTETNPAKISYSDFNLTVPNFDSYGHAKEDSYGVDLSDLKITINEAKINDDGKLSYAFKQGTEPIGTIDIPYDLILESVQLIQFIVTADSIDEPKENCVYYLLNYEIDESSWYVIVKKYNNNDGWIIVEEAKKITDEQFDEIQLLDKTYYIQMLFKTEENTSKEINLPVAAFSALKGEKKDQITILVDVNKQAISAEIVEHSIGAAQLAQATYDATNYSLTLPFNYNTINIKEATE